MITNEQTADLLQRRFELLSQYPKLRARNAAAKLGVSEGEVVAARCGDGVMRLRPNYHELLKALVNVGQVLTITRNEYAVHEKRGYYSNLELGEHIGGTFDYNINLRLFFRNWAHIFAVSEQGRKSLQVFDRDGTSVHKIYQTDNGDAQAWDQLVELFHDSDQTPGITLGAPYVPYIPAPREQADKLALCEQWRAITDIHEFWHLLRDHKLRRIDALHLTDRDLARPVAADAWRSVLEDTAKTGLPIMVFTRSPGVAQIHTGPIHKLVEAGGWFNILDANFNLHLWAQAISEAWVVYRPTSTGGQTSLELYHENGELIFHMFGAVNTQAPELRGWRSLLNGLASVDMAVA